LARRRLTRKHFVPKIANWIEELPLIPSFLFNFFWTNPGFVNLYYIEEGKNV
jgi:prolipoprotein diacylglyceryltransferase